ncbi:MAG: capsular biosynthesis protein [Caulobacter vibrioides]|uniref:Capsular biosynthesis protein n=1 Tax=Caulobacter vibrioides TaxID=155892 RepID=A0A258D6X3_CAUVI|nr:MAG: capsular biosynthesis protein [Caulobacter vibrioides]
MASFVDLSNGDFVPLSAALHGPDRVARALLIKGGMLVPPRPMLWPCPGELLNGPHIEGDLHTPDVDLMVARRVVAGGSGAHLKLDGQLVYAKGAYPYYIQHWYQHDIARPAWDFDAPVTHRLDRAFVITHFNFVWGHWLTEMYPKLFVIRALKAAGITAPLLLPRTAPSYAARIVRMMLPDQEIITYDPRDEAVEIGAALLPHMLNRNYVFHDFMRWNLEREALSWTKGSGDEDMLFVSRGGVRTAQSFRELENEAEIEGLAQEAGLTLVRPETLGWDQQVRLFSRARLVAGEFGSGLHNALLSPQGCQVVSLNWLVEVQSRIGNFRRHDIGYILPADGQARLYSIEPQANQPFTIDPAEFRQKLAIAVDRAQARKAMAGWDDAPFPVDAPTLRL